MEQSVAKEFFEMRTPEEIKAIKLALMDIETMCGHCPYEGEPNGCNRPGGICKMFDVALDAAEAISQLEARWISVNDRLPERGITRCIIAIKLGNGLKGTLCARYNADLKSWSGWYNDRITSEVTHWMPLPQPPEEE